MLKTNRKKDKIYFPGLNSLRFFAAFVVIIHHIEQIKSLYGYDNYFNNIFIRNLGGYGVTFFFALSGFLITYLLLYDWNYFVGLTRIDCMTIGAIAADWLYEKKQILQLFYSRVSQLLIYTITGLFLSFGGITKTVLLHFNQEIFAILSTSIIINIATNKKTIIKLNNPIIDYLGKISYGLYMYHSLCITISFYLVKQFTNYSLNDFEGNIISYLLTFSLTIIFSAVSYRYFEKPFIKLKRKYSTIISGMTNNSKD